MDGIWRREGGGGSGETTLKQQGKSAGVTLHLVNKNTTPQVHTSVRMTPIAFCDKGGKLQPSEKKKLLPVKGSIEMMMLRRSLVCANTRQNRKGAEREYFWLRGTVLLSSDPCVEILYNSLI